MAKKYAGLDALRTFLDNLKNTFAALNHTHKISDLTDYTVDETLSSTSTNPVKNKVIAEKFETLTDEFAEISNELDSKVSSVNGKNGTVTVTGADIPLEEGSQTLIAPYINSINSSVLQMNEKIKNHTSFLARRVTANTVYINLGKFTGDNGGGKAIITISGNPYWGGKNDGGFRVLTLSSNTYPDISSTDIHTGASLYDFGQSNYTGTEIIDDPYNIQVALVRPSGYSVAEVDIYLKFNNYQYNSYLVTVDYSDGCSWVTSTEKVTTSDPDPMENALSAFIVPKKTIGDNKELKTPKEKAGSASHTAPYCQSELAIDDFTKLNDYRTIIGTISGTNEWNNIISVRHRNGSGDGQSYGMYLRAPLTYENNLIWRQQTSSGWRSEKTLLDNSNYASYIPQATTSKDGLLSASDKSKLDTDLKSHTSFYIGSGKDNVEYIKLGKFTGNGNGGRAIFTINGKPGWNNKNDGGLKILTLSSNYCPDSTSTNIWTGGTFYTFGHSNDDATDIVEGATIDIVLVRTSGYSDKEVDVYIKHHIATKYISYFVTVDYSDNCSWTTSTAEITSSDTNPTANAMASLVVPKKIIADATKMNSVLGSKADVETGTCTLRGSNASLEGAGTVTITNATYHVVGKMVTVHFTMTTSDAGSILVSDLPYAATKRQSGVANEYSYYSIGLGNNWLSQIYTPDNSTHYYTISYFK